MAITAEVLRAPRGPLTDEILTGLAGASGRTPAEVAAEYAAAGNDRVAAWPLTDTFPEARRDEGAFAWAAAQALRHRAQQILTVPTSASAEGEGSRGYSPEQAKQLLAQAEEYRLAFLALELEATAPGAPVPAVGPQYGTVAAPLRVRW